MCTVFQEIGPPGSGERKQLIGHKGTLTGALTVSEKIQGNIAFFKLIKNKELLLEHGEHELTSERLLSI